MLMLDGVKAAGKGICWAVYWHEGRVMFNQPHKAAFWMVLICMMND